MWCKSQDTESRLYGQKRSPMPLKGNHNVDYGIRKHATLVVWGFTQNGCDEDTAKELMSTGTLQDIEDYIEVEEVLYAYWSVI